MNLETICIDGTTYVFLPYDFSLMLGSQHLLLPLTHEIVRDWQTHLAHPNVLAMVGVTAPEPTKYYLIKTPERSYGYSYQSYAAVEHLSLGHHGEITEVVTRMKKLLCLQNA